MCHIRTLAFLCLLTAICAGQAIFRSDVRLVNVSFSVRDAGGKLIENLTQDDFEVFEDGAPQKVSFFAKSTDVPLRLALVVDLRRLTDVFPVPVI